MSTTFLTNFLCLTTFFASLLLPAKAGIRCHECVSERSEKVDVDICECLAKPFQVCEVVEGDIPRQYTEHLKMFSVNSHGHLERSTKADHFKFSSSEEFDYCITIVSNFTETEPSAATARFGLRSSDPGIENFLSHFHSSAECDLKKPVKSFDQPHLDVSTACICNGHNFCNNNDATAEESKFTFDSSRKRSGGREGEGKGRGSRVSTQFFFNSLALFFGFGITSSIIIIGP